jgi:SPW repeat-containing protein
MATPLVRRPDSGGDSPMAVPAGTAAAEYVLPADRRGIAAQATAALSLLTGLWVALSPVFLTLQHGGANANVADVIAGLAAAGIGAFALASPRGFPGLQFAGLVLGVWVIVSPFILNVKFAVATSMYWSNTISGGVLVLLALAGLATLRRATR